MIGVTGNPPSAILFDWDHTLVNSFPAIARALNQTFEAFGLPQWTELETRQRSRKSIRDAFPALFGDKALEAAEFYRNSFEETHLQSLSPLPGAEALLKAIKASGLGQAVVSNKTGRFLRKEADHLGWTEHFVILVGATDAPADKPDPACVNMALAALDVPPGPDVWFIGDTAIDMDTAKRSGCLPILIGDGHGDDYSDVTPHRQFSDLLQFTEALHQGIGLVK